jgi:hypothetical protein
MESRISRIVVAGALCLGIAGAAAPAAGTTAAGAMGARAAAAAPCGITWGSGPKTAGTLATAPLAFVRTGQHECYDRTVFEFAGPVDGYAVQYANQVLTEGRGLDLVPYTAGGAWLAVSLRAPAGLYTAGEHTANVVGYSTLRDVVYGGSFEGYTTFAVGVRARLPFQVVVLAGPGSHGRIVLDVAHRWDS